MKKIILSSIISTLIFASYANADFSFRFKIQSPSFISNDWDNDGQPNDIDPDDDNDGLMDAEDSTPFGRGGQNSVPNVKVNSFTASKNSYFSGEIITLYWDVDNIRTLSLYNDSLLTSYLGDLTNKTLFNVSPVGDMTYYLDTETSVVEKKVYLYNEVSKSCNSWSPDASTVNEGNSFTQTRSCNVEYASNEPSVTSLSKNETQTATGTLVSNAQTLNYTVNYYRPATYYGFDNTTTVRKYSTTAPSVPSFEINGETIVMETLITDGVFIYVRFYNTTTLTHWTVADYNAHIDSISVDNYLLPTTPMGITAEKLIYWKGGTAQSYLRTKTDNTVAIRIVTK